MRCQVSLSVSVCTHQVAPLSPAERHRIPYLQMFQERLRKSQQRLPLATGSDGPPTHAPGAGMAVAFTPAVRHHLATQQHMAPVGGTAQPHPSFSGQQHPGVPRMIGQRPPVHPLQPQQVRVSAPLAPPPSPHPSGTAPPLSTQAAPGGATQTVASSAGVHPAHPGGAQTKGENEKGVDDHLDDLLGKPCSFC